MATNEFAAAGAANPREGAYVPVLDTKDRNAPRGVKYSLGDGLDWHSRNPLQQRKGLS